MHISKWIDLTKNNLKYQWLIQEIFEIPKLKFFETELNNNSTKI